MFAPRLTPTIGPPALQFVDRPPHGFEQPPPRRRQPDPGRRHALIVEAHAVDHRLVLDEAEQPGPGIARLGTRRQRADLDEAEAEAEQLPEDLGVLVETGGEPDRIGEMDARHVDRQHRIGPGRVPGREALQHPDRPAMRPLRVEGEGEGPEERVERHGAAMAPFLLIVTPAKAGVHAEPVWLPACAGMTG